MRMTPPAVDIWCGTTLAAAEARAPVSRSELIPWLTMVA
jgi:hypothetical protein